MIKIIFDYIHKLLMFSAILCFLPLCVFASEPSVNHSNSVYLAATRFEEVWLSKTEVDQTIVEKYLLEENASPPMDIIPMLRLFAPEDYRLARDIFLILSARSKAEIDGLLTSRIDYKDKSLTKLQADGKQAIWVGLAVSYLSKNEDKALQIVKVQLGITQPADQLAALAGLYEDLSERDPNEAEYRSRAIINLQKSIGLKWHRGHADKLLRLLLADKRIDEVVDHWRQIIIHDNQNITLKCSFIRYLLRCGRKVEAIAAIMELDIKSAAVFREIVPEMLHDKLYEETVRLMQRSYVSNQFYYDGAAVFWLSSLAHALHLTGDKRGAVAALREAESFARHHAREEYQLVMDATKEIDQKEKAKEIGKTITELDQTSFTLADPGSTKDPVIELTTSMEFGFVPEGCLQMGSLGDYGNFDERPAHTICVNGFYIGTHEVTQEQYEKVMGLNPSNNKGANLPVDSVSWDDTQKFIRKFAKLSGREFRLPTEAEWEYAARNGRGWRNTPYSGGSDHRKVGWGYDNSDGASHPVGQKRPNDLGIFDMTGNVNEWCQDFYNENYYQSSPRMNPQGPSSGTHRVYRGGAWNEVDDQIEITNRRRSEPIKHLTNVGFRLVLIGKKE